MTDWRLKYRPQTFNDVIGQEEAIRILQGPLQHAYLLYGNTGSGKTTLAKIFANELNAEVVELDANNLGKQDILELKSVAEYRPLIGSYKVFIMDEAHTLSNQAWNSLLTIIEESPKTVIWLFCTTEYHKIISTIENRVRKVPIKKIPNKLVEERLQHILSLEGHEVSASVIQQVIEYADGSLRSAITELQTFCETGTLVVPFTSIQAIELLNATYTGADQAHEYISKATDSMTEGDIKILLKTLSDVIAFFTATDILGVQVKQQNLTPQLIEELTSLPQSSSDYMRKLATSVMEVQSPDNVSMRGVVNTLVELYHNIMKSYNRVNDNRMTLKVVLMGEHLKWFKK